MEEGSSSRSKKRPAEDEADSSYRSNKRPALEEAEKEEAEEVPFDPRRCLTLQEIIQHSPSGKDGMEWKMEAQYRRGGCFFIRKVGMALKLSRRVIATASYYFNKFFMLQSFANINIRIIGTACVFIASKGACSLRNVIVVSYCLNYTHNREEAMKRINESQVLISAEA
ncbi:cyclin-T1-1-like [Lotus japonicus]|uniref:cyclin-T1-1-like n=1 Tax=Lotus japonicus TaxID=34305 RepID=UPI0025862192|nr:cyclin-T1-1-like [Lotus japonicus]